ncbi:MAG: hypothetical protein ACFFAJ_17890, partial [Candidatus Hodarchaeota archaeon]
MTTSHPYRDFSPEEHLQPVCLKQPRKPYQLPSFKGPFLVLLVFLFLLIPLVPGNEPTPGLFKSSSFTKSVFFPPLEEEPSDLIHTN